MPAATRAEAGRVRIQASTLLPATPQRTADSRLVAPTPLIAEVLVWVGEAGRPSGAVVQRTAVAEAAAASPCGGARWIARRPGVRMIRQPPEYVPRASTAAVITYTHSGVSAPDGI